MNSLSRIVLLAAAAAGLAACRPADMKVDPLSKLAQTEFGKGDVNACEKHATEAIDFRTAWWRDRGVPDLTAVHASDLSRRQAETYETRAHCRKTAGKLAAAVADMEQAAYLWSAACKDLRPGVDFGNMKEMCQTAANSSETAAVWKKELSSAGRKP